MVVMLKIKIRNTRNHGTKWARGNNELTVIKDWFIPEARTPGEKTNYKQSVDDLDIV